MKILSVHKKVHPLVQSSTLEVLLVKRRAESFHEVSGVLHPDNDTHNLCQERMGMGTLLGFQEDGNTPGLSGAAQQLGAVRECGEQELQFMVSFTGVQENN